MLDIFNKESGSNPNIQTLRMDAIEFSQKTDKEYDRLLLKHVVHLFTHEQRLAAFQGFYKQLKPKNGKLLIVVLPSNSQLPFDERTQQLFFNTFPPSELYIEELEQAGFKQIHHEIVDFTFDENTVTVEDWIKLLQNRIWTPLSIDNINEQQMLDLVHYIRKKYETEQFQLIRTHLIIKCCTSNE